MNTGHTVDARALIESRPLGRAQYGALALLFLILAVDGLDTMITSYLAPGIAREWQVSMGNLGLIFSVGLAGTALGALTLGALGDWLGLKRLILIATLLVGLATTMMSRATSIEELATFRFMTGFGVGGTLPNLIALAAQLSPTRLRATLITLTGCGFPAGATLAGLVVAAMLEDQGWRTLYLISGIFPLLLVPLILFFLPESIPSLLRRANPQPAVARVVKRLFGRHSHDDAVTYTWISATASRTSTPIVAIFREGRATQTLMLSALFFLCLMNVYFLSNWLPTLLEQAKRTQEEAIVATTVFNFGGMVGALALGRLIDRLGYVRVLSAALVCAGACLAILATVHFSYLGLLTAAFFGGFVVLGGQGGVNALPALIYPDDLRATASGWAIGTGRLGSVTGPILAGWLLSSGWPYQHVLMAAALVPVAAALMVITIYVSARRRAAFPSRQD